MSVAAVTATIRDAHRDLTRARLLDAALDLLRHEDLDALKMAQVAARAGMTERTLYRHFPTRDDLLKAAWRWLEARVGAGGLAHTPREVAEAPLSLFANFDAEEGAVRAATLSRTGRELRRGVNKQRQGAFRAVVRVARPDLSEPELTRLCAAVQLLTSAFAWAAMKDFWDLDGAEAALASSEAIKALLGLERAPTLAAQAKSAATRKESKS